MFNVCAACGAYRVDKEIDSAGPFAICPECDHAHPFRRLPLLMIGGASGSGKSTTLHALQGTIQRAVLLESDILWRPEFDKPDERYREFFEIWLRLCKNVGQSGRPVVLFGAGMAVPENVEHCVERRYFAAVHYLALVCDGDVLAQRLRRRPAWRQSGAPAFIDRHISFNRWFRENGSEQEPPVTLLDTTATKPPETASAVRSWIRQRMTDEDPSGSPRH